MFYATQRLGCHNPQHVLLSRFEGMDAAEPDFGTYFPGNEEGGFLCRLKATAPTAIFLREKLEPLQKISSGAAHIYFGTEGSRIKNFQPPS
jgi:hypothetical protein